MYQTTRLLGWLSWPTSESPTKSSICTLLSYFDLLKTYCESNSLRVHVQLTVSTAVAHRLKYHPHSLADFRVSHAIHSIWTRHREVDAILQHPAAFLWHTLSPKQLSYNCFLRSLLRGHSRDNSAELGTLDAWEYWKPHVWVGKEARSLTQE